MSFSKLLMISNQTFSCIFFCNDKIGQSYFPRGLFGDGTNAGKQRIVRQVQWIEFVLVHNGRQNFQPWKRW